MWLHNFAFSGSAWWGGSIWLHDPCLFGSPLWGEMIMAT